jgi:hypothetical protein
VRERSGGGLRAGVLVPIECDGPIVTVHRNKTARETSVADGDGSALLTL